MKKIILSAAILGLSIGSLAAEPKWLAGVQGQQPVREEQSRLTKLLAECPSAC